MSKNVNTKASEVTFVYTEAQGEAVANAIEYLVRANDSRVTYDSCIHTCAAAMATALGTNPSFEFWEKVCADVKAGLMSARKLAESSATKSMSDVYAAMRTEYDLVKPKKQTASAISMSKARAELAALTDKQLDNMLAAAAAAGDYKGAAKYQGEIDKRKKAAERESSRAQSSQVSELRKSLKTWVNSIEPNQLAALLWVRQNWDQVCENYQANIDSQS